MYDPKLNLRYYDARVPWQQGFQAVRHLDECYATSLYNHTMIGIVKAMSPFIIAEAKNEPVRHNDGGYYSNEASVIYGAIDFRDGADATNIMKRTLMLLAAGFCGHVGTINQKELGF